MLVLGANALTAAKNASFVSRFGNSIKILSPGDARSTTRSSPSDFDVEVMSKIRSSDDALSPQREAGRVGEAPGDDNRVGRHSYAQPFDNQPLRRVNAEQAADDFEVVGFRRQGDH